MFARPFAWSLSSVDAVNWVVSRARLFVVGPRHACLLDEGVRVLLIELERFGFVVRQKCDREVILAVERRLKLVALVAPGRLGRREETVVVASDGQPDRCAVVRKNVLRPGALIGDVHDRVAGAALLEVHERHAVAERGAEALWSPGHSAVTDQSE